MTSVTFSLKLAQDLSGSPAQFPVNFDDAWVWLGYSRKDSAKRNFDKVGFVEDVDYQIHIHVETNQDGSFSHRWEEVRLTCECLKHWGMAAGTNKGREVRMYFLQCEKQLKSLTAQQPQSTADMLLMYAQAFKEHELRIAQVEAENVEIQHRLEAVDMETAANAAEIERYSNGHGFYMTIAGWCNRHDIKKPVSWMNTQGRKAAALCRQKGLQPVPVKDTRFGQVNSYPDSVLVELNWD